MARIVLHLALAVLLNCALSFGGYLRCDGKYNFVTSLFILCACSSVYFIWFTSDTPFCSHTNFQVIVIFPIKLLFIAFLSNCQVSCAEP